MPKAGSIPIPKIKKGLRVFMREAFAEMKKVHWPTKHETTRLTNVVYLVCVMVVAFLFTISLVLEALFNALMGK
ncbi:MAG: preprotein translocase subunit SecE [Armatimonadetes bacterium]|nr:preprotein translocase subunit SecE [Armatimonadota bacterium]